MIHFKKYLREKFGDSTPGRNDDGPLLFSFSSSSNDFSTKASSISIVDVSESIEPLDVDEDIGVAIIIKIKRMYYTRSKKNARGEMF
jgi:hypothetical protein